VRVAARASPRRGDGLFFSAIEKETGGTMRNITLILAAALAGTAFAASKPGPRKDPWKYAGEDHGVRFFFQPDAKGGIRIKVENGLDTRVDVLYRVMDTDWKMRFASSLQPHGADSTIRYRPSEKDALVRYPYFDQVFLERVEGAASAASEASAEATPGRS
jgi:hypothetical protein